MVLSEPTILFTQPPTKSVIQLSWSFQLVQFGDSSVELKGILIEVSRLRPSGGGDEDLPWMEDDAGSLGLDSCSPLGDDGEEY